MIITQAGLDFQGNLVIPGSFVRLRGEHPHAGKEGQFVGLDPIVAHWAARIEIPRGFRQADGKFRDLTVWVTDPREWELIYSLER